MRPNTPRRLLAAAWLAAAGLVGSSPVRAHETVAVLSSASGSYQAAFDGFAAGFKDFVPSYRLPDQTPETGGDTRVVVAFGGEAAARRYPERSTMIVCLAPGLADSEIRGRYVRVDMKPAVEPFLAKLRLVQPRLARLAVLWNSENTSEYLKELKRAGAPLGITVYSLRVDAPAQIPDLLRSQVGKIDALWLAPDPRLITPQTFQTVKQFSWDNDVPFYAPTAGLAAAGASAAVSVSPAALGREAAELAKLALTGAELPKVVFPADARLTVNLESARKAGLSPDPAALGEDVTVIR